MKQCNNHISSNCVVYRIVTSSICALLIKNQLFVKRSQYIRTKNAKKSKFTGEGAFATRDIPANTIYANYGGFLHTKYEENSKIA